MKGWGGDGIAEFNMPDVRDMLVLKTKPLKM